MDNFDELLKIQRRMADRIARESETDRQLKLMDIINSLVTDKKRKVQVENIIYEAKYEGIDENTTLKIIDDLISLGFLEKAGDGFVRRV